MPEEAEPKIENEDAALNEADDAVENAIKATFGPNVEISGLEKLDSALKKMINGVAGDMFAKKAEDTEEPSQEEVAEETEDDGDDIEQAVDNFAKEPVEQPAKNAGETPETRQPEQHPAEKQHGQEQTEQQPVDQQNQIGENRESEKPEKKQPPETEAADGGGETKDDGTEDEKGQKKKGKGDDGDKEKKDKGDNSEKEKMPETNVQQPEQPEQKPERPIDEQSPAAGQQENQEQPTRENAEQGPQSEEQQEEQPKKKQLERSEKGGLTQGINALRNRGETKKIDEQIKNLEKQRKPLSSAKRKLLAVLIPLEIAEKSLVASILFLRIIQWTIYLLAIICTITIILFILGVAEIIWGAGASMNLLITPIKLAKDALKKNIKKIKGEIKKIDKKLSVINNGLQKLAGEKRNIINRSMIESNKKQRQEEEQNRQDLET